MHDINENNLSVTQLWLLTLAVEYRIPLRFMSWSAEHLSRNFQIHVPDSTPESRIWNLRDLERRSLVTIEPLESDNPDGLVRSPELLDDNDFGYELTSQGADAWELNSKPDWNRFLTNEAGDSSDTSLFLAATRDRLDTYVEYWSAMRGSKPAVTSEPFRMCPWKATYWKVLPEGFGVELKDSIPSTDYDRAEALKVFEKFRGFEVWCEYGISLTAAKKLFW